MATKALPKQQFDNVVRAIKRVDADRLTQLQVALEKTKGRLGVRVHQISAVHGVPKGSDQFDAGSIVTWLDSITADDQEAVLQVKQLLATLWARL